MQPRRWPLWPFLVVCLAATIVASLFAPFSWKEYVRYVTAHLGWELPAAFLTASGAVIVALFMARRSRASGIVAVCIFASVVLHMLLVPVFGVVTLKYSSVVAGHEIKREIAFGLPSLSESIAGQELRARFNEMPLPDTHNFAGEKESAIDLLDAKPASSGLKLKQNDFPDRAPGKMKIDDQLASNARQTVQDSLVAIPDRTPEATQPQIARLKSVTAGEEALKKVKLATRELKVQHAGKDRLDMPKGPASAPRDVKLEDARRDLSRETIEVASSQSAAQKIQEIMRGTVIADKPDRLDMKVAGATVAKAVARPVARMEHKLVLDASHQAAPTPEAPAPKMLTREVATARPGAGSGSLAASYSASSERRTAVDDAAMRDTRKSTSSPAEVVRIRNTIATAKSSGITAQTGEKVIDARSNLRLDRESRTMAGVEVAMAAPRAQVDLEAGQAGPETSFVAARPGKTSVAPAQRPGIRETLSVAARAETASELIMTIGATAKAARSGSTSVGDAAPDQRMERSAGMAASRAETGIDNVPDRPGVRSSIPVAVDLSRNKSSAMGMEMKENSDATPAARLRAALPGTEQVLVDAAGGASLASELGSVVKLGSAAMPAAGGVNVTPGVSGTAGDPEGSREGRQDLSAARRRTGGLAGTETAMATRLSPGDTLGSGVDVGPGALDNTSSTPVAGVGPSAILSVQDTADIGNGGAAVDRTDSSGLRIIPGVARTEVSLENPSPGGGTGSSQPQTGTAAIIVEKATNAGGDLPGTERGMGHVSVLTSGRDSEHSVSLVEAAEVAAGSLPAGGTTSGISSNVSLSRIPGTEVAGSDRVAIGIAARAATGVAPAGGPGDGHAGPIGPTGQADVRVAKADGKLATDVQAGGGGRKSVELDSFGDSLSLSRAPARLDVDVAGSAGSTAGPGIPTGVPGASIGDAPKTIISSELSEVPASVPEKAIYKLRDPGKRKEFIAELGGSEKTEQSVERALAWLAGTQSDDGRWDIDGFKTLATCGGPGDQINEDTALTGLCLLSYLGAGYTHVKGEHKETVRKAVNWLIVGQKEDGNLQRDGQMYGQAIGTVALCECYSMTGDKRLLESIQKAVEFILKAQNPGAGWRYAPRKDNDTSVTGWQVLALKSAMIAGIKFPPEHFAWVEKWLDSVRRGDGGGFYTYMPGHGATPTMTAEGWFCQLLMKEQTRTRGQAETIPYLMEQLPAWTPKDGGINLYFWYYATLALHMSGAQEFQKWNQALTKALLAGQTRTGPAAGSWDPVDVLGERGGRIYSTATATLCLEVYYRYLPFYKQR